MVNFLKDLYRCLEILNHLLSLELKSGLLTCLIVGSVKVRQFEAIKLKQLQHETNSTPKVKSKLETTIINPNMLFQIYISMEDEREKVISTLDDHDAELSMKC